MSSKSSVAIAVLTLLLSACSMFDKREWAHTEEAAEKAVGATRAFLVDKTDAAMVSGKSWAQRMASYVRRKEILQTFHDAGDFGEDAILLVKRRASIGGFTDGKVPGMTTFEMPDLPVEYIGEYQWPVQAGVISSEYGRRFGRLHKGMDVAADVGEPIHAMADGYVIYASNKFSAYGNLVILKHDENVTTFYAHNSKMKVKAGQRVTQGQVIALLGNTGRSTGPHSHFEFRRQDAAINPRQLLGKGPFEDAPELGQLDPLTEFLVAFRD